MSVQPSAGQEDVMNTAHCPKCRKEIVGADEFYPLPERPHRCDCGAIVTKSEIHGWMTSYHTGQPERIKTLIEMGSVR